MTIPNELDEEQLFYYAFLLGMIQSPLYLEEKTTIALNDSSLKLFWVKEVRQTQGEALCASIALFNRRTHNLYVGPNNGLASFFYLGFSPEDLQVASLQGEKLLALEDSQEVTAVYQQLFADQPLPPPLIASLDFGGDEPWLVRDGCGRPSSVKARIWLDSYGNIKTTAISSILHEAQTKGSYGAAIELNGVRRQAIYANSFAEVGEGQLFLYSGSSAALGPNPRRTHRFLEVTANGRYGLFGADFFKKGEEPPHSGQWATLTFLYRPST